jgi:NTP pyrophosphatase (non-canonical NTP hydrolase)
MSVPRVLVPIMDKTEQKTIITKLASRDIWEQLNQTQEECAELIVAINHFRRGKKGERYNDLCSEVADVRIMIDQLCSILDRKIIDKFTIEKLCRANERIQNGQL